MLILSLFISHHSSQNKTDFPTQSVDLFSYLSTTKFYQEVEAQDISWQCYPEPDTSSYLISSGLK